MYLWRYWLALSTVNRKVGGSSPPRDDIILLRFMKYGLFFINLRCRNVTYLQWNLQFQRLDNFISLAAETMDGHFDQRTFRPMTFWPGRLSLRIFSDRIFRPNHHFPIIFIL